MFHLFHDEKDDDRMVGEKQWRERAVSSFGHPGTYFFFSFLFYITNIVTLVLIQCIPRRKRRRKDDRGETTMRTGGFVNWAPRYVSFLFLSFFTTNIVTLRLIPSIPQRKRRRQNGRGKTTMRTYPNDKTVVWAPSYVFRVSFLLFLTKFITIN